MKQNKVFGAVCTKVASASCLEASKHLHELQGVSLDEVIECRVTVDEQVEVWVCVYLFGTVLAISWESGQVLDYKVLSKHCMACSRWKEKDK